MRGLIFCLLLFFSNWIAQSQILPEKINIGIFAGDLITSVSFTPSAGVYEITNQDNLKIMEVPYHNTIVLEHSPWGIQIKRNDSLLFICEKVHLRGKAFTNSFIITPLKSNLKFRVYDGDLNVIRNGSNLRFINSVSLESYVAGTVQSESGFNRPGIFYQVQAVIIRTYALRNLKRHEHEGFHLCDKVHCQAYYSKTVQMDIADATEFTRGQVVVDSNATLLNTVYHANCGGQTVNSEDLWIQALPYLRSDVDTFCRAMPGAVWQATIPASQFRSFLQTSHNIHPNAAQWAQITSLDQENHRIHHIDEDKKLHLSRIRQHFGLRSTFFSITASGSDLLIRGRGYGHGVGLCQEGAIERARQGHSKNDILLFYYKGALIRQLEPIVVFD
jgi:stage II sporulation protein D